MLLKHKNYEHHIDFEIKAAKNSTSEKSKKEIDRLPKPRRTFTPQLMWKNLNTGDRTKCFYPSMFTISRQSSVVSVERLFSKIKLIKTRLRNQLSQVLLRSAYTYCNRKPKGGFL